MHRYRIVAQISLALSIINLGFAAPAVALERHYARGNVMAVVEDVPVTALPKTRKRRRELEAASGTLMSPRSPPDADVLESSQRSENSIPDSSSNSSISGRSWLSWLTDRLTTHLTPDLPPPPHEPEPPPEPLYPAEPISPLLSPAGSPMRQIVPTTSSPEPVSPLHSQAGSPIMPASPPKPVSQAKPDTPLPSPLESPIVPASPPEPVSPLP